MGHMFLIAVRAHSKWPEVFCMNSTSSAQMVEMLRLSCFQEQIVTMELDSRLKSFNCLLKETVSSMSHQLLPILAQMD